MDQVRPLPTKWHCDHATVDRPASSSSNPIRWRPRADPVQKQDPGERTTKKGLTNRGPLQKGGQSEACPPFPSRFGMHGGHGARTPLPTLRSLTVIARSEANEAIHLSASGAMDCFASLAMTETGFRYDKASIQLEPDRQRLGAIDEGSFGDVHLAIEGKRLQSRQQFLEQDSHFHLGKILPQTEMRTVSEGDVPVRLAIGTEREGILEDLLVPVTGRITQHQPIALGDLASAHFGIGGRRSHEVLYRGRSTE